MLPAGDLLVLLRWKGLPGHTVFLQQFRGQMLLYTSPGNISLLLQAKNRYRSAFAAYPAHPTPDDQMKLQRVTLLNIALMVLTYTAT